MSESHCGSFWKILISFSTWLGLPVKFIAWNFMSFSWNVRTLRLVYLHAWEMQALNWIELVMGGCVGVQYPVVDCDNVNMGAFCNKIQRCYKYLPTPLFEHKVMCNAHGPFFARLRYNMLCPNNWVSSVRLLHNIRSVLLFTSPLLFSEQLIVVKVWWLDPAKDVHLVWVFVKHSPSASQPEYTPRWSQSLKFSIAHLP